MLRTLAGIFSAGMSPLHWSFILVEWCNHSNLKARYTGSKLRLGAARLTCSSEGTLRTRNYQEGRAFLNLFFLGEAQTKKFVGLRRSFFMKIEDEKNSSSNRANLRKLKKKKTKTWIFSFLMKGLELLLLILRIVELVCKFLFP